MTWDQMTLGQNEQGPKCPEDACHYDTKKK